MSCKEKIGVLGVHTPPKANQKDCTLLCARFTDLKNHRVEWFKPSDDQAVVIQTTDPNRSTLWRVIALLRRGWSRWTLFRRVPCSGEERAQGWG